MTPEHRSHLFISVKSFILRLTRSYPWFTYATKKGHRFGVLFSWRRKRDFRLCDLPDKQWVSTVYPNGKFAKQIFSIFKSPFFSQQKRPSKDGLILLAEKEGFEPSLRLSHTTPLAGEPLRPLGYFSKVINFVVLFAFYREDLFLFRLVLCYVITKICFCQSFFNIFKIFP